MDVSRRDIVLGSAALLAGGYGRASSAALPLSKRVPPVRQVDHIMIRTGDPDRLFAFFTQVLRLPVAWPLMTRGQVRSGGVGFGNVNVEAIRFPGQPAGSGRPQLIGFGFEPNGSLEECLAELRRRGVAFGAPRPFVARAADGAERRLFTNVTLSDLSDSDRPSDARRHVFVSEYSPDYVDVDQRRSRLRTELEQSGGGPLGIHGVREIVVGTPAVPATHGLWLRLLIPLGYDRYLRWAISDGPAVRLVRARQDRHRRLTITVRSLQQASDFLRSNHLLGPVSQAGLAIRAPGIGDLEFLRFQV